MGRGTQLDLGSVPVRSAMTQLPLKIFMFRPNGASTRSTHTRLVFTPVIEVGGAMARNEIERTSTGEARNGSLTDQPEFLKDLVHPATRRSDHPDDSPPPGNDSGFSTDVSSRALVSVHPNPVAGRDTDDIGRSAATREHSERRDSEHLQQQQRDQERRDQWRLDRNRLLALERLRTMSGFSRRRAARRMGVSASTVRSWEDQRSVPTVGQLDSMVDLYGTGLDDLLGPREPLESSERPGVLVIGDRTVDTNEIRARVADVTECNRRIVVAYLDAVRDVRGYSSSTQPPLRSKDLIDLARVLDVSDHQLDQMFADEFGLSPPNAQRASRALMVAGLANTTSLAGTTVGWIGGPPSVDGSVRTDPRRADPSSTDSSVFATVTQTPPDSALRKPMFTTTDHQTPRGHRRRSERPLPAEALEPSEETSDPPPIFGT